MSVSGKEGWYEDPAGRHDYRWFSAGVPTDLVKDRSVIGHDAISMSDPGLFAEMNLAQPPDIAPLLHQSDSRASRSTTRSLAAGYDPLAWVRPGLIELAVVLLPLPIAILVWELGAPAGVTLGLAAFSLVAAAIGHERRRRRTNRLRRAVAASPPVIRDEPD